MDGTSGVALGSGEPNVTHGFAAVLPRCHARYVKVPAHDVSITDGDRRTLKSDDTI
jgi:hypothetical protein